MIQAIRKQNMMTQMQLANKSGISRSTIARIESGKTKPNIGSAAKLAAALNCTIDELVANDERKEEK